MNAKGKEKGWVLTPGGWQVQGRGTEAPPGLRISSSKGCLLPLVLPSELPPHQGVPQALLGTGTPGRRMLGEVVLNAPPLTSWFSIFQNHGLRGEKDEESCSQIMKTKDKA